ncbi:MAG: long-chain fatty acid--CoA ligase [Armatimonadota bacterium]|nr:long-chain fatty acid--CoA ligase [Armatimonadota bacterium]
MAVDTLSKVFWRSVEQYAEKPALLVKREKQYRPITYRELGRRVFAFARALYELGVREGDRVAIMSENRPEWAITDWATISLNAITVPIYPTLTASQALEILIDAEPKVLVVSDQKQLQKACEALQRSNLQLHLVVMDPEGTGSSSTFEQLLNQPGTLTESAFESMVQASRPDAVMTFIYTSGTTGEPKGAMLTHRNFLSNIEACLQVLDVSSEDVFLSFLPLSHVFERMAGHFLPIYVGITIAYAESLFTLANDILEVRPTVMLGVPRFYTSVMERILASARQMPPLRQKLFYRALEVGKVYSRCWRERRPIPLSIKLQRAILDRLVASKIRARVGGRLRFFVSGGAALPKEVAEFFDAFGILILEGYGLTETSPVLTVNPPNAPRFGSVGKPIPGVEIKIAPDGEILARGPNIMVGYYKKPEATAAAIEPDGWFHTGDIGYMDKDGYLYITDRKKDIIVLANGKNVAPQPIENLLKQSELVQEAVVYGDGMSAPVALIVPNMDALRAFAQQEGIPVSEPEALINHDAVQKRFRQEIERVNRELADFQRIKGFRLIAQPFTIESGELTPTLKVKRRVVAQKYAHLLEELAR